MLEGLCQRFAGAGYHDQMDVIRHQAITQQSKTMKVGVVPQQLQISKAVPVAGEYYLPGIPTLGNMVGDVRQNDAGEAGHGLKVSERMGVPSKAGRNFCCRSYSVPTSGENNGASPVCPRICLHASGR
jgi:hypothetical protein